MRLLRAVTWLLVVPIGAGCSAIVDADRFRPPAGRDDGGVDGGVDAAPADATTDDAAPADAGDAGGPDADASPADADADAGGGSDGAPDAGLTPPTIVPGRIDEGEERVFWLQDVLLPSMGGVEVASGLIVVDVVRGFEGRSGAVVLRAPVDPAAGEGTRTPVRLTVPDARGTPVPLEVEVVGRDELDLEGEIDVASLAPVYSSVRFGFAGTRFVGRGPARVRSAGRIDVDGAVSVAAGPAPEPGPGGGAGGGASADGEGPAPGGGGDSANCPGTGAGGSNRTRGGNAIGDLGGTASPARDGTGLAVLALGGSGGGGGGTDGPALGEPGGGGGGVLVLDGRDLAWLGGLDARGGDGRDSQRADCGLQFGAASGGGSGGAIFVRTRTPLTAYGPADVSGGAGGLDGAKTGGSGGDGWLFVSAPAFPPGEGLAGAIRYPAWGLLDPPVVSAGIEVALQLRGEPEHTLTVRLDAEALNPVELDDEGSGELAVTLEPGLHGLCATDPGLPGIEAACVEVVALP